MKEAAFQELLESVRQMGRIRRGELRPSRTFTFRPADVEAIRAKLGRSQSEFALMIGVSVATLRHAKVKAALRIWPRASPWCCTRALSSTSSSRGRR